MEADAKVLYLADELLKRRTMSDKEVELTVAQVRLVCDQKISSSERLMETKLSGEVRNLVQRIDSQARDHEQLRDLINRVDGRLGEKTEDIRRNIDRLLDQGRKEFDSYKQRVEADLRHLREGRSSDRAEKQGIRAGQQPFVDIAVKVIGAILAVALTSWVTTKVVTASAPPPVTVSAPRR